MKKFVAVFLGSATSENARKWEALDEKARGEREAAGMKAWGDWVQKHQKAIVEMGSPLGATKQVDAHGISDINNLLTAYTIVQAQSHDEAAKLFVGHPHFSIFPGDTVEVMECLPVPGM